MLIDGLCKNLSLMTPEIFLITLLRKVCSTRTKKFVLEMEVKGCLPDYLNYNTIIHVEVLLLVGIESMHARVFSSDMHPQRPWY